ncbi:phospholipase effector Tle1 domain-containing protein [Reyranella massiliensis]|uniref:phospholipase effector Tle1 domain-containing protein n=1 Tax=Reyranella massiliensis TaxID=445220 RepID=UPI00030F0FC9|nr:DUF2235 domain-containing protein [Reyranella massiliensis]
MKRLIVCFDGTWNRLDAPESTNVVLTAEGVVPMASGAIAQVIFYDEGVGTRRFEKLTGGMFGHGLVDNMSDAYRFLIFNYTVGDEIYIFGFSRGAFTARSFASLLSTCGILLRSKASQVTEAIKLYQARTDSPEYADRILQFRKEHSPQVCVSEDEDAWRCANLPGYSAGSVPRLQIAYLGVWDTVGALGVPSRYRWLQFFNRKHRFHDTNLSSFVRSARHAVAIDERRADFTPTLWSNIDDLNVRSGSTSQRLDAPYQQKWFPGVHGAVGGGGEHRGLSDQALDWVLTGARKMGLELDGEHHSRLYKLRPDPTDYLSNEPPPSLLSVGGLLAVLWKKADRDGPDKLAEVSLSARRRWHEKAASLRDKVPYKPKTLAKVENALDALNPADLGVGIDEAALGPFDLYVVLQGETLSSIAFRHYENANAWTDIYRANLDKIEDPNLIYVGQELRLPKLKERTIPPAGNT